MIQLLFGFRTFLVGTAISKGAVEGDVSNLYSRFWFLSFYPQLCKPSYNWNHIIIRDGIVSITENEMVLAYVRDDKRRQQLSLRTIQGFSIINCKRLACLRELTVLGHSAVRPYTTTDTIRKDQATG